MKPHARRQAGIADGMTEWMRRVSTSVHVQRPHDRQVRHSIAVYSVCIYVLRMPGTIQIRNVPDALRRQLKSRAARTGMSLSNYLLGEIRHLAERPTLEQLRARLERRSAVTPSVPPAQAIRDQRGRFSLV